MPKTKTEIIKSFLAKNPAAGGKAGEAALRKHGISAAYFSVVKSKLKNPNSKKKGAGRSVKRRVPTAGDGIGELQSVAALAKEVGGLDRLAEIVDALKQVQM